MSYEIYETTLVDPKTAIDEIEPLEHTADDLRDFAVKSVQILNAFAAKIESGLAQGTMQSVSVSFWSVAYALGLNCAAGVSMTARSASLNVKRATLSKGARAFCLANNLPPSHYMKDEESSEAYSAARLRVVANTTANPISMPNAKPPPSPP